MPTPIVLPTITAIPKPNPRTRSKRPRFGCSTESVDRVIRRSGEVDSIVSVIGLQGIRIEGSGFLVHPMTRSSDCPILTLAVVK